MCSWQSQIMNAMPVSGSSISFVVFGIFVIKYHFDEHFSADYFYTQSLTTKGSLCKSDFLQLYCHQWSVSGVIQVLLPTQLSDHQRRSTHYTSPVLIVFMVLSDVLWWFLSQISFFPWITGYCFFLTSSVKCEKGQSAASTKWQDFALDSGPLAVTTQMFMRGSLVHENPPSWKTPRTKKHKVQQWGLLSVWVGGYILQVFTVHIPINVLRSLHILLISKTKSSLIAVGLVAVILNIMQVWKWSNCLAFIIIFWGHLLI